MERRRAQAQSCRSTWETAITATSHQAVSRTSAAGIAPACTGRTTSSIRMPATQGGISDNSVRSAADPMPKATWPR